MSRVELRHCGLARRAPRGPPRQSGGADAGPALIKYGSIRQWARGCQASGETRRRIAADLLLTIEGQEGRWRSLMQIGWPVRVGCGRYRSLRLLHFAAALGLAPGRCRSSRCERSAWRALSVVHAGVRAENLVHVMLSGDIR